MSSEKQNILFVLIMVLITNICSATTARSQLTTSNPDNFKPKPNITNESQQEAAIRQREKNLRDLGNANNRPEYIPLGLPVKTSPEEAARRREEIENWNKTKQMLRPPDAYYVRFAELLKNEDLHLMRLFIEKKCDEGKTVSVEELERCDGVPPVKGGGSLYSFRLHENNSFYGRDWWDIHFIGNRFSVGNDTVQTIIADIGAVYLPDVNLKTKAFKFLKDYKPVQSLAEIKEKYKKLEKGIEFNNYIYSNSVAVNFDSTYVLRSIAYRLNIEPPANIGRGLDSFVAFKIVGREQDGSLVIIWKELRTDLPRRELK